MDLNSETKVTTSTGPATCLTVPMWNTTSIQTFIALVYRETGVIESILTELLVHVFADTAAELPGLAETQSHGIDDF